MDARGNKLSSCKIQDQYLKKKLLNFQNSGNFCLKRKKGKNSEYNSVVFTTLKRKEKNIVNTRVLFYNTDNNNNKGSAICTASGSADRQVSALPN